MKRLRDGKKNQKRRRGDWVPKKNHVEQNGNSTRAVSAGLRKPKVKKKSCWQKENDEISPYRGEMTRGVKRKSEGRP